MGKGNLYAFEVSSWNLRRTLQRCPLGKSSPDVQECRFFVKVFFNSCKSICECNPTNSFKAILLSTTSPFKADEWLTIKWWKRKESKWNNNWIQQQKAHQRHQKSNFKQLLNWNTLKRENGIEWIGFDVMSLNWTILHREEIDLTAMMMYREKWSEYRTDTIDEQM